GRWARWPADSWAGGASGGAKGAKYSEPRSYPCPRAQARVSKTSHSLNPFGVVRRRGIDESDRAAAQREAAKWRKPAGSPAGSKPIANTASSSSSRKSASRAMTKPRFGSAPRHVRATGSRFSRSPGRVSRALRAVQGLAHLADRAAVERDRGDVQDCLVPVVQGVQPVRAVEPEPPFRRAEDGDAPVARVRVLGEAPHERVEALRRADRVAGDDGDAAGAAGGGERVAGGAEEVRLAPAQHERRERIPPPRLHERAHRLALVRLLPDAVPPWGEPRRDDRRGRDQAEQQHGYREPLPDRAGEMG